MKLAEAFDVATDYLLVEGTARRPFRAPTDLLGERLANLDQLSDDDRAALIHIIDGLLANTRVRNALAEVGGSVGRVEGRPGRGHRRMVLDSCPGLENVTEQDVPFGDRTGRCAAVPVSSDGRDGGSRRAAAGAEDRAGLTGECMAVCQIRQLRKVPRRACRAQLATLVPVIIVTDNGPCYKSDDFKRFIAGRPELAHVRTRHHSRQTNGVVERFNQTLKYKHVYRLEIPTGRELAIELEKFRRLYNDIRPHETLAFTTPTAAYLAGPAETPAKAPIINLSSDQSAQPS